MFEMNIVVEENRCQKDWEIEKYSRVPGHRNREIEPAVWHLAAFLHCALETRWQLFGQFLSDFLNDSKFFSVILLMKFLILCMKFLESSFVMTNL